MPQLNSGRHVGVSEPGMIEAVMDDGDSERFAAIFMIRTTIRTARDLADLLPVVCFDAEQGQPPDCPAHSSGFLVSDIREGHSDWSDEEVSEFIDWIDNDPGLQAWLEEYRRRLEQAIRAKST